MTKGLLAESLATATEMKKGECSKVKKTGKLILPGIARVVTRTKPVTKAGKRKMFGKTMVVKARPAKTIVKAFPVAALKQTF